MIRKEDYAVIKTLSERGVYQKDIADQLNIHPKTVSRALCNEDAPSRSRKRRGSKLDPYKDQIDALLAEDVWNAVVILREIEEAGYEGGSTILRQYIHPKRVLRSGKRTVRFETKPGRQMQCDWGELMVELGEALTKVYFMVNQLAYSRRFHFWCTNSLDAEHTYEGIIRSFEYFGGVTVEVLVDNPKTMVLEHRPPNQPRFNERFLDLSGHYGFIPRACRPYRARTKGKDERMVRYIKENFFQRYRQFESWAHMNQVALQWLREEADPRMHGTVKEVVSERFQREAPTLSSLPTQRFDTSYIETRQVAWDGYIEVRGNRYSVPAELAGRSVTVRIGLDDGLCVYHGEKQVVQCLLKPASQGWVTVPEHHARLWQETLQVTRRPLDVYEEVSSWS